MLNRAVMLQDFEGYNTRPHLLVVLLIVISNHLNSFSLHFYYFFAISDLTQCYSFDIQSYLLHACTRLSYNHLYTAMHLSTLQYISTLEPCLHCSNRTRTATVSPPAAAALDLYWEAVAGVASVEGWRSGGRLCRGFKGTRGA